MSTVKSVIFIFLGLVGAFLLVHFFALFGVFAVFAYVLLYFLIPNYPPCLTCNSLPKDQYCPLCQKPVGNNKRPKSFRSVLLNALILFVFSALSVGIVFAENYILQKYLAPPPPKTVSFVIHDRGQYKLGAIFPMKIEITGMTTPINAVQADLSFDPNYLEIVEISTQESFADIFIQKEIDNERGLARLTGGLPNPGYFSDKGLFGTVLFKGKVPGLTQVAFLPTSLVLANDGSGTNTLKETPKVSFLILPDEISEEDKLLQNTIMVPVVLGKNVVEAKETKLYLYESDVLGKSELPDIEEGDTVAESSAEAVESGGILKTLLTKLNTLTEFTTSLWERVYYLFIPKS